MICNDPFVSHRLETLLAQSENLTHELNRLTEHIRGAHVSVARDEYGRDPEIEADELDELTGIRQALKPLAVA